MNSPAQLPAPAARATFLNAIRAADLFTPTQLTRVEAAIPPDLSTPADVARALVAGGFLTRFQADRLLAGRIDGFHLGSYVIVEQIGRGTMAQVYRAKHRTMNRPVAIKVLSPHLTRSAAAKQTLQRGMRAAAQLNHPNVVTTYDANEFTDRLYLVLEFVGGPNLETLVREQGPLPVTEACEIARQAALGLEHAHAHKLLHQDVKPANLLVSRASLGSPERVVKITDFGVPRTLVPPAPRGTAVGFVGTPDYVAPEQAHNPQAADHRADLYGLGAVLYFMLTGQPLFPGGTPAEKVQRQLWEKPIRIERFRGDVHSTLAGLLHQLLAKHPSGRPQSAAEVAARLEEFAAGRNEAICHELPPLHVGPYLFVPGQLSGSHPVQMATPLPERSGQYPLPASGAYPFPIASPAAETSPWELITATNEALPASEEKPRKPRRKAGSSQWVIGLLVAGLLVATSAAVSMLVRVLGR